MYAIRSLLHRTDISMSAHGFAIDLAPEWRDAVAASELNQESIDTLLNNCGRTWLDATGYDRIYDPDNCGFNSDRSKPPGPRAEPAYIVGYHLRVTWGEWGPEHICVPGNACGLDIDRGFGCVFEGGKSLTPHNIDCLSQKYLLLVVFTEIAEHILLSTYGRAKG